MYTYGSEWQKRNECGSGLGRSAGLLHGGRILRPVPGGSMYHRLCQCIKDYQREPKKEVTEGTSRIPTTDFKVYDPHKLETAIAHILKECKDCKEDHTENCIINVIRNCYEVGLLGDIHSYEGSALQYLMYLKAISPESAGRIADIYMS